MGDLMAHDRMTESLDRNACAGSGAWSAFLRAHALVTRRVEADLLSAHRLSLVSFEVLERLADAPGHRLRMADLAELLVVSRSGVTRAVDRLERDELVTRERCDSDLRGTYAALTDRGMARLLAAAPTHQAGVQFYLLDPLGPGGDVAMATALGPVADRLATSGIAAKH
jgi:DNA-binding MarR family transcriptional regulator